MNYSLGETTAMQYSFRGTKIFRSTDKVVKSCFITLFSKSHFVIKYFAFTLLKSINLWIIIFSSCLMKKNRLDFA